MFASHQSFIISKMIIRESIRKYLTKQERIKTPENNAVDLRGWDRVDNFGHRSTEQPVSVREQNLAPRAQQQVHGVRKTKVHIYFIWCVLKKEAANTKCAASGRMFERSHLLSLKKRHFNMQKKNANMEIKVRSHAYERQKIALVCKTLCTAAGALLIRKKIRTRALTKLSNLTEMATAKKNTIIMCVEEEYL